MDKKEIYSSKKALLEFLGIKDNFLYGDFSNKYREKDIPKKSGGVRTIKPPSPGLKKIQRQVLDKILYSHTQLPCVFGLSKDTNILNNAKKHQSNTLNHLLTLDIENFFPSISQKKVREVFIKIGFTKENSNILTKICTVDGFLPQGAPTSPYLASMVCIKLDKQIYSYCKSKKFVYTRYFDDISVSGKFVYPKDIDVIEKIIIKNGFVCKEEKKKFFDFNSEKNINNIVISECGMSVTNEYKDQVKTAYIELIKNKNLHNERIFSGKFGFYLHVNRKEATSFLNEISSLLP